MQALIDFFVTLGDVIVSLVEFIISFISDLIFVIGLLGSLILKIPMLFAWFPSAFVSLLITIFGIVVIYKILGREG